MIPSSNLDAQIKTIAKEYMVRYAPLKRGRRYESPLHIPLWAYLKELNGLGRNILDIESTHFNMSAKISYAINACEKIGERKNLTSIQMSNFFWVYYGKMISKWVHSLDRNPQFHFLGCFKDFDYKNYSENDEWIFREINNEIHEVINKIRKDGFDIGLGFLFDERLTNIILMKQLEYVMQKKIKTPKIRK